MPSEFESKLYALVFKYLLGVGSGFVSSQNPQGGTMEGKGKEPVLTREGIGSRWTAMEEWKGEDWKMEETSTAKDEGK